MIQQIQKEIEQVKQKLDVAIMAHSYQGHEILEVADAVGDSFQLSKQAQACGQSRILLCGVHFMAETAKLLSPESRYTLPIPVLYALWRSSLLRSRFWRKRQNIRAARWWHISTPQLH